MTTHRRPLLVTAAAAALMSPACLFVGGTVSPTTPPETAAKVAAGPPAEQARKPQFAELRPGTVIPAKRDGKDTATARRPADPKPDPRAPGPQGQVTTAAEPPGPLPPITVEPGPPPEPPLLAAAREFVTGHPDRGIERLQALDKPNQDFVLAVLPILVRGAAANLVADPEGNAALVEQLRAAADRIEPQAALKVDVVTFCQRVYRFGGYDPWPAGQPYRPNDQAHLYFEVRNLVSQPTPGPNGETHLTHALAALEIRDAHGKRVPMPDPADWRRRVEILRFERKLPTRGPVHDFHVMYGFPVPPAPGVYTATLTVSDPLGRTVKAAPVRFDVAGP